VLERSVAVAKTVTKNSRAKAAGGTKRRTSANVIDEEEQLLQEATKHLILKHGSLWVATGVREERVNGSQQRIITVHVRYPTGHEGYIGDLLYRVGFSRWKRSRTALSSASSSRDRSTRGAV